MMRKIWKLTVCFVCTLAVAGVLYFYSAPLLTQLGRWQVTRECGRALGTPMSHTGIEITDGAITIHNPCFTHTVDENQGWNLSAETLLIQGRFLPWQKDRFIDITIVKPNINVYTEDEGTPVADWFQLGGSGKDGRWHLEEGTINVYSATHGEVIRLDIDGAGELGVHSTASLRLTMPDEERRQVTLSYTSHDDGAVVGFDLHNVSCAPLIELVQRLDPRLVKGWQVDGGMVEGGGRLHLPKEDLPYAIGQMEVRELAFRHLNSQAKGWIPLTTLELQKEPRSPSAGTDGGFLTRLAQGTRGQLELSQPGRIVAQPHHTSPWALENLTGNLSLYAADITLDLQSTLGYGSRCCFFHAAGRLVVSDPLCGDLGLSWIPSSSDAPVSTSRVLLRETTDGDQLITLDLVNIGDQQAVMLHAIAGDLFPEAAGAHLSSGQLSGVVELVVHDGQVSQIAIEELAADNLAFTIPHWKLVGELAQATGAFSATVADSGRIHNVSSSLKVAGGGVQFQGADGAEQLLGDVEVDLRMIHGALEGVHLSAKLDGLKGTLTSGHLDAPDGVQIQLSGPIRDLSQRLPVGVRPALSRSFDGDFFEAEATVRVEDPFFTIEGLCQVTDLEKTTDRLPFGLRMRHIESDAAASPSGLGVWLELAMSLAEAHLSDPVGQVVVEDGWVSGRDLQAAKYALPLIRKPTPNSLTGSLDFDAYFENDLLTVQYEARDVELDCNAFSIKLPKIGDLRLHARNADRAFHYLNLLSGEEAGVIPVQAGHFIEHHTGLEFEECSGCISLQPDRVEISAIETTCQGLHARGTVTIEDIDDIATDVTVKAETMEGPIAGAQALLAHITSSPILDLPIQGRAAIEPGGFDLVLHLNQPELHEAKVVAHLFDAQWESTDTKRMVRDLHADVAYDHNKRHLGIRNLLAIYEVEDATFDVTANQLTVSDFPTGDATFDVSLRDPRQNECLLKGKLLAADADGQRILKLNTRDSHIGALRAKRLEGTMRNWTEPVSIQLESEIDLTQARTLTELLDALGLISLSDSALLDLLGPSPSGTLQTVVNYEKEGGLWAIEAYGTELTIADHVVHQLEGTCKGSAGSWTVDHLMADHLCAQGALQKTKAGWELPFLHAAYGESAAVEVAGVFDPQTQCLAGELRSVFIALDRADELPYLGALCQQLNASGQLLGHGQFRIEPDTTLERRWSASLDAEANLDHVTLAGVFVQPETGIHLMLSSQGELRIEGIQAALLPSNALLADRMAVTTSCQQAACQLGSGNWQIDALHFQAPDHQLAWLTDAIRSVYPGADTDTLPTASFQALQKMKPDGVISGTVSAAKEEGQLKCVVHLEDGTYQLGSQSLQLKNAEVVYQEGGALRMNAQTIINGSELWVSTLHDPQAPDIRELVVSDCSLSTRPIDAPPPLVITLRRPSDQESFSLERIKGTVKGAFVDLSRQPVVADQKTSYFAGTIRLQSQEAYTLLPGGIGAFVQKAEIGGGYTLTGHFALPEDQLSRLSFSGTLTGEQFIAKGYQLESLQASVQCTPEAFVLRSLAIHDPAGQIHINRIAARKQSNGKWAFEVPSVKMTNLQPGLLHAPGEKPQIKRPLVITHAEITGLRGDPSGLESWTGKGAMHFSRTLPASAQLQIPEELRHRQNLSSSRLTPAQGTVHFSIHDRGFYIDKMQNTFSEGKQTQFYLAKGQGPSYIDFDGQLHLKMRVKQRNLILKLTEPFTVHVKGPLERPRWSLRATKKVRG